MKLKKIDLEEFKKVIYPEYKQIFPIMERKPYIELKRLYEKGITSFIEILDNDQIIGFFIVNSFESNLYIHLDYFAILPSHQSKGYGSKAIKLLEEMYKDYDGIFIEIEKVGLGHNENQNQTRQRRARFYENLGFKKMNFDIILYTVRYSCYILTCSNKVLEDEFIVNKISQLYNEILGKSRMKRNCKIIR